MRSYGSQNLTIPILKLRGTTWLAVFSVDYTLAIHVPDTSASLRMFENT